MASSFYQASSPYENRYLCLSCYQTKDIANNRSKIDWTLESKGGNVNYYSTGPTTVTIAGQQVYYIGRTDWSTKSFPAAKGSVSGTLYVDHDSVGNMHIAVSFTTAIHTGTTSTYSDIWYLDNIPRQATVDSANDFNDQENPTITFSNAGNFPINARLEFAGTSIHRENIANIGSYTFDLTEAERELLRQKCIGDTMPIRLVIGTKINSTEETHWDWEDKTFHMSENDATKPVVSMSATLNNSSLPSEFSEMCIQGKSRLDVNISAQGKYSANILSYSADIGGQIYNSDSFLSNVLSESGTVDVIGYAKDSRQFTGFAKQQFEVIPYSKPLVIPLGSETAIQCYRSDGNGKRIGNSTSVWIKAKMSHYSLSGKNQCALQWRRKLVNEAWNDNDHKWKDLIPKTDTTTTEYNALLAEEKFDKTKSYTIQIMAIDDIGEKDVKIFEIPTQDVALHLGKGGKNVSVGAYCDYSEDYTFYSDWKAIFDKGICIGENKRPINDFVIERGTDGIWTYEKWASGKAVCYGVTDVADFPMDNLYSSVYYSEPTDDAGPGNIKFPENLFCEAPTNIHIQNYATAGLIGCHIQSVSQTEVKFYVSNPTSLPMQLRFTIEATGKWKQ